MSERISFDANTADELRADLHQREEAARIEREAEANARVAIMKGSMQARMVDTNDRQSIDDHESFQDRLAQMDQHDTDVEYVRTRNDVVRQKKIRGKSQEYDSQTYRESHHDFRSDLPDVSSINGEYVKPWHKLPVTPIDLFKAKQYAIANNDKTGVFDIYNPKDGTNKIADALIEKTHIKGGSAKYTYSTKDIVQLHDAATEAGDIDTVKSAEQALIQRKGWNKLTPDQQQAEIGKYLRLYGNGEASYVKNGGEARELAFAEDKARSDSASEDEPVADNIDETPEVPPVDDTEDDSIDDSGEERDPAQAATSGDDSDKAPNPGDEPEPEKPSAPETNLDPSSFEVGFKFSRVPKKKSETVENETDPAARTEKGANLPGDSISHVINQEKGVFLVGNSTKNKNDYGQNVTDKMLDVVGDALSAETVTVQDGRKKPREIELTPETAQEFLEAAVATGAKEAASLITRRRRLMPDSKFIDPKAIAELSVVKFFKHDGETYVMTATIGEVSDVTGITSGMDGTEARALDYGNLKVEKSNLSSFMVRKVEPGERFMASTSGILGSGVNGRLSPKAFADRIDIISPTEAANAFHAGAVEKRNLGVIVIDVPYIEAGEQKATRATDPTDPLGPIPSRDPILRGIPEFKPNISSRNVYWDAATKSYTTLRPLGTPRPRTLAEIRGDLKVRGEVDPWAPQADEAETPRGRRLSRVARRVGGNIVNALSVAGAVQAGVAPEAATRTQSERDSAEATQGQAPRASRTRRVARSIFNALRTASAVQLGVTPRDAARSAEAQQVRRAATPTSVPVPVVPSQRAAEPQPDLADEIFDTPPVQAATSAPEASIPASRPVVPDRLHDAFERAYGDATRYNDDELARRIMLLQDRDSADTSS